MAYRSVQAGRGLEWLSGAVALLLRNPAPFLLMGLLLAVIMAVPLLGGLAMIVLGPAFYAGFMSAARRQEGEGSAEFSQLFDGFQQEGKLPKLLVLCLPAVVAMIVLGVFALIIVGGALLGGGLSAATGSDAFALAALGGGGMVVFVLIALAVGFVAHALVFFAVPRVMFDELEPFAAMKESWRAVMANIGAVLVFMALVVLAYLLLTVLLGWISPLLLQLVAGIVVVPVVAAGVWRAYRDVFGEVTGEAPVAVAPPPAPADEPTDPPPAP